MKMSLENLKNKKLILLSVILAFVLTGCATAPDRPKTATPGDYEFTKSYVSWLTKKLMDDNDIPIFQQ